MVLQTHRPAAGEQTAASAPGRGGLMLAVLLLGQFMCVVDVLVVNVAMPSIARDLHASGASLQLLVGGYTIAYAMLLITGARLGDRCGRRRTHLAGVIVFTSASLACALAPDSQVLVGFRFVQGAGAAVLVPQVFSIIQLTFTGAARARALSAYAAVLSAGAVAGLVLGGVVVTANLFGTGWRPFFAINVPIGIVLAGLHAGRLRRAAVRLHAAPAGGSGPERAAGRPQLPAHGGGVRPGRLLLATAARRDPAGHRPGRAGRQRRRLPGHRGRRERGDVRHGLLAGRPVRRGPAGGDDDGPGRTRQAALVTGRRP